MARTLCWKAAITCLMLIAVIRLLTAQSSLSPTEAQAIAKAAYIYGHPMVQTYLTMYAFSVNAFCSLMMYDLPRQLLVKNPIHRYLINSPMLPNLKFDSDGGLTLYIQCDSPGPDKESNWLPAPKAPFMPAMRYYLPKRELISGTWKSPSVVRTN